MLNSRLSVRASSRDDITTDCFNVCGFSSAGRNASNQLWACDADEKDDCPGAEETISITGSGASAFPPSFT